MKQTMSHAPAPAPCNSKSSPYQKDATPQSLISRLGDTLDTRSSSAKENKGSSHKYMEPLHQMENRLHDSYGQKRVQMHMYIDVLVWPMRTDM